MYEKDESCRLQNLLKYLTNLRLLKKTFLKMSYALKRAQLADIDNETKWKVTGYIRNQHKLCFKSSDMYYFNIFGCYTSLCTLYYHSMII